MNMPKMHSEELDIDEKLVHSLIKIQCPQWSTLQLQRIASSGTDNALFRLGLDLVVRLPRLIGADSNINKEYLWLPQLANFLSIPISVPLFKGHATDFYPSNWMISQWNFGSNPVFEVENEYGGLAKNLADFLNQFHQIPLPNGPQSRRGLALNVVDDEMRISIAQIHEECDIKRITEIWNNALLIPGWSKEAVWVHGDFLPGNILVKHNRLSAVLDFSDVGMGDPACDCVIAWALMNNKSRIVFKNHLKGIDENTWIRGRAWALSIAVIMLPYYRRTNPVLVALAKRVIDQILSNQ